MSRISLTRYLVEEQRQHNTIEPELRLLIEVVARACKAISNSVSKGALAGILGSAGTGNVQGETQQKLDVIANEVLLDANEWGGHLAAMLGTAGDEKQLEGDGGHLDQSSRVQAVVDFYGPANLFTIGPRPNRTQLIGADPQQNPEDRKSVV